MSNKVRKAKKKPNARKTKFSGKQAEHKNSFTAAAKIHASGDIRTAEKLYIDLIKKKTKIPQLYSNLALIYAQSSRTKQAHENFNKALALDPKLHHALINQGNLYKLENNYKSAAKSLLKACAFSPEDLTANKYLTSTLLLQGHFFQAEKYCLKAIKQAPIDTQLRIDYAKILLEKGEPENALQQLKESLKSSPNCEKTKIAIAHIYQWQGQFEQASDVYEQVIKQNNSSAIAHFNFAKTHRYKDSNDSHLQSMTKALKTQISSNSERSYLYFALAKAFEELENYEQSFKYLSEGNSLKYSTLNYDVKNDIRTINNIIDCFERLEINKINHTGVASNQPIFIVGLPRSGTSLVEKILSSHSQVTALGELEYLPQLTADYFYRNSKNNQFRPITQYPKILFKTLANEYLLNINQHNAKTKHITDKMPLNSMLIGLIYKLFPNARIIHCERNPIDNCFSIFKQIFESNSYKYGYNLTTLGQFFKHHQSLMQHWKKILPKNIYTIKYESLTTGPETEIKNLINACGLHWEQNCLDFNQTSGLVKTASFHQVRQPIYSSSVEKWKNYEQYLSPLLKELAD